MKTLLLPFAIYFLVIAGMHGQVTGYWNVVDDEDGIVKSIVEIYEKNNQYHGRIIKLLPTSKRTHCDKCSGALKGKPLTGMTIIYNLDKTVTGGKNGKVIDPASGKLFSCSIELEGNDKLKLRGYLGVPTMGKTSYWNRAK